MSGVDLHNLQITLTQIPHAQKLTEPTHNYPLIQGQAVAVVAEDKRVKARSQVKKLSEAEATDAEDPTRTHHRKQADGDQRHIDLTI